MCQLLQRVSLCALGSSSLGRLGHPQKADSLSAVVLPHPRGQRPLQAAAGGPDLGWRLTVFNEHHVDISLILWVFFYGNPLKKTAVYKWSFNLVTKPMFLVTLLPGKMFNLTCYGIRMFHKLEAH